MKKETIDKLEMLMLRLETAALELKVFAIENEEVGIALSALPRYKTEALKEYRIKTISNLRSK